MVRLTLISFAITLTTAVLWGIAGTTLGLVTEGTIQYTLKSPGTGWMIGLLWGTIFGALSGMVLSVIIVNAYVAGKIERK